MRVLLMVVAVGALAVSACSAGRGVAYCRAPQNEGIQYGTPICVDESIPMCVSKSRDCVINSPGPDVDVSGGYYLEPRCDGKIECADGFVPGCSSQCAKPYRDD